MHFSWAPPSPRITCCRLCVGFPRGSPPASPLSGWGSTYFNLSASSDGLLTLGPFSLLTAFSCHSHPGLFFCSGLILSLSRPSPSGLPPCLQSKTPQSLTQQAPSTQGLPQTQPSTPFLPRRALLPPCLHLEVPARKGSSFASSIYFKLREMIFFLDLPII